MGVGMGIGFTLAMGIVMLLSFGHSRILMSHGYLFYFFGIAVGVDRVRRASSARTTGSVFIGWLVFYVSRYLTWYLRSIGQEFFFKAYAAISVLILITIVLQLFSGQLQKSSLLLRS